MVDFHSSLYKTGMANGIFIKEKYNGMHKSEGKAVVFHLKKPNIGVIRVSFLY